MTNELCMAICDHIKKPASEVGSAVKLLLRRWVHRSASGTIVLPFEQLAMHVPEAKRARKRTVYVQRAKQLSSAFSWSLPFVKTR